MASAPAQARSPGQQFPGLTGRGRESLLRRIDWKLTIELIGVAAIVASLIFVGLQLQQDRRIAEAESYLDAAAQITELGQLINENRDVWIRGLDGEELNHEEELAFRTIYWAVWVRKISQWQRAQRLDAGDADSVSQGFAYDLVVHPGLRRAFERNRAQLTKKRAAFGRDTGDAVFAAELIKHLAVLDANPPQLPEIKNYYIY